MNEEDKDKNEDIQTIDVSEDTSNENKSTDDQIALRVFQYIKDFIFCVGFLVLAYMSFWVVIILSILSFIVRAVDADQLSELNEFSRRLSVYIKDCLLFSTGNDNKKPFPFDKFPE
ncbi:MAG: DUF4389 domain-containing protein [Pseudomonadota bacterium]|nr:DUF4389 domain-containing protein [Pseudomonadota bacterium]|tara:strand:+ start:1134 stop:1481 length:348 start_codon:yes stop_codon:yes gene_type:complete